MIEEMISKFNNQSGENAFIRVDDKHILDLYIGFDKSANYSILMVSDVEPIKLTSSLIIDVEVFQRKDLRWTTVVSLKQVQYLDLFYQVSYDLIESSRNFLSEATAQSFFFERYKKWQNLLKRNRKGLLGPQEIKGLIGELFFLKMFMLNSFDFKESIESWTGPEKTKQDFILQDTWFEVKSITSSVGQVRISSISQLDTTKDGYLTTVKLDKTSSLDIEKITLNSLYEEILQMLENDQVKLEFENKLFEFGYINRKEYDYETFRFMGIEFFRVNQNFPKLLREKLPIEIVEATYEISLSGIEDFRIQKSIKKLGDLWN